MKAMVNIWGEERNEKLGCTKQEKLDQIYEEQHSWIRVARASGQSLITCPALAHVLFISMRLARKTLPWIASHGNSREEAIYILASLISPGMQGL